MFSIGDTRYANQKQPKLAYKNADGQTVQIDVTHNDSWNVSGAALDSEHPWVALYGGSATTNNVGYVVHEIGGSLNEQSIGNAAVSLYGTSTKKTAYLVLDVFTNEIKTGDYAELLVEAYTWNWTEDYARIQNEAETWPAAVQVTEGTLLANFPALIEAESSATAEFTVQGGVDYVPVTITGFDVYGEPYMEKEVNGSWEQVDQSVGLKDDWQTDMNPQTGKYEITYVLPAEDGKSKLWVVDVQTSVSAVTITQ